MISIYHKCYRTLINMKDRKVVERCRLYMFVFYINNHLLLHSGPSGFLSFAFKLLRLEITNKLYSYMYV